MLLDPTTQLTTNLYLHHFLNVDFIALTECPPKSRSVHTYVLTKAARSARSVATVC